MRRTILALSIAAAVAGGIFVTGSAQAMTRSTPAAVQAAIDDSTVAQDVALVCRRVWTAYGWRRHCYETGPRWRGRYWRGRHWRRW